MCMFSRQYIECLSSLLLAGLPGLFCSSKSSSGFLLSSCGLYGKAGSAGLSGADLAAQAPCGHLEGCAGCSFSAQTLRHHLLWGQRRRQVHQPRQGSFKKKKKKSAYRNLRSGIPGKSAFVEKCLKLKRNMYVVCMHEKQILYLLKVQNN